MSTFIRQFCRECMSFGTFAMLDLQAIATGDKKAYESLFRTHYQPLCGFAVSFLKDGQAAQDLVQDLFFRLWKDREKINITTSAKAYLYTSVRNRCYNALKQKGRVRSLDEQRDDQLQEEDRDELELADRIAKVRAAIDALPPERGKVFKMSRYQGMKYQEIADELNISIKTVENQMGKALKTLRVELADLMPLVTLVCLLEMFVSGWG